MIANADFMDSTATGGFTTLTDATAWEDNSSDHYHSYSDTVINEYKSEELDLWMIKDRKEWREYLRALWLDVLATKQYLGAMGFSNCKLYYRRLLFSVSGWLARAGQNKKN